MPNRKKKGAGSRKRGRLANQRLYNRATPVDESQAAQNETEESAVTPNAQAESPASKVVTGIYPVKIHSDSLSEVWHKFDVRAGMFKSHVNVHYMSPVPFESPGNVVMLDLFEVVLKKIVPQQLNHCCVDGMDYKINTCLKGLWVAASGFNKKLPILLKTITTHMVQCSNLLTEDVFNLTKEEKLQVYYKKIMDPFELVEDLKKSLSILHYPSYIDMYAVLTAMKFEQFQEFARKFTERMYVQFFVQGTMEKSDVIDIAKHCIETLNCRPLLSNTTPQHSVNEIPRGIRCCRVRSFNRNQVHSCVTNYYQFDEPSLKLTGMIDYLKMVMLQYFPQDNIFDLSRITFGLFSYDISSEGLEDESMEAIDSRIETGRKFLNDAFERMSTEDLLYIKANLIREKNEETADMGLEQNIEINWSEIMFEKYAFDRAARELKVISEMPVEVLRATMLNFTAPESDPRLRKLSVQVVGYADPMENGPIDRRQTPDNRKDKTTEFSLKYLTRLSDDTKEITGSTRDHYILDIQDFRRGLKALPWQMSCI